MIIIEYHRFPLPFIANPKNNPCTNDIIAYFNFEIIKINPSKTFPNETYLVVCDWLVSSFL